MFEEKSLLFYLCFSGTDEVTVIVAKRLPINPEAKLVLFMSTNNPNPHVNPPQMLGPPGNSQVLKKHRSDLKLFSSIGGLHARINFLHTCSVNNVIPKGFRLTWKEETGYSYEELSANISTILNAAALKLLNEVLQASKLKHTEMMSVVDSRKSKIPQDVWTKCIQNYNFCYNQASQRLTNKLKKISTLSSLQIGLPHHIFHNNMPEEEPLDSPPPIELIDNQSLVNQQDTESKIFFTPDMICPVPYDPNNFRPILIDDVSVSDDLIELASLSPSFSPTPLPTSPPDGLILHQELLYGL